METLEPNTQLVDAISGYVSSRHPELRVMHPNGSTIVLGSRTLPSADIVLWNPANDSVLGIEVTAKDFPMAYGVYPKWKSLDRAYKAAKGDFLVFSGSSLPDGFSSNVNSSGMTVITYGSIPDGNDAVFRKIESHLSGIARERV